MLLRFPHINDGMTDIALALGGGGVKGYAHVGVLRALQRHGFRIRALAGTSIGGLVGAAHAAGFKPDEIEKHIQTTNRQRLFNRLPGDGPAMLGLAGVTQILQELLGERTFADLALPFAVTAVDLDSGQLLALKRGKLVDAIMATIALPGIFPPRVWEGLNLIDGGVLDPVPVSLARRLAPDLPVVAVVLTPSIDRWKGNRPPRLLESLPFLANNAFVHNYLSGLRITRALDIFLNSIDIAGIRLTEMRLQIDNPEVVIRPAMPAVGILDEVDIKELVELGEAATEAALPELRNCVGWRGWITRRTPFGWMRKNGHRRDYEYWA